MSYKYTIIDAYTDKPKIVRVTTDFLEIERFFHDYQETLNPYRVDIHKDGPVLYTIRDRTGIESWRTSLERSAAWKFPSSKVSSNISNTNIQKAVEPNHYKNYVDEYWWLEAMLRIPRYRNNPEAVKGALELQTRKYLDRIGKDERLQELKKALFNLACLVHYTEFEKCPSIDELHVILKQISDENLSLKD